MKGWKTLLAAVATAIFGVLEAFDFTNIISGDNAGFIIAGLGIGFAYLRKITTTALGSAE
jgi:hypothetical protein